MYRLAGSRKRIFITFDYDYDRNYRYLLSALNANSSSDIEFDDTTPSEIQSNDIGRIKAVLSRKIKASTHALVIIGEHANSYHPDRVAIGDRNWQWWEINKSKAERKKLVAVKIKAGNPTPDPLYNAGAKWAKVFKVPAILRAITEA